MMDMRSVEDTRQRAVALIEEAGTLLGMIPRLLDDNDSLRAAAQASANESEGLRGELDALRSEIQQLRAEREEFAEVVTRLMSDVGRLGELAAKPRGAERRSPFWRDPSGGTPGAPASGAAWR